MRRIYQISGCAILAFAGAVAYSAAKMRFSTSLGPGPGFFPLWLSIALGLLALVMILSATFGVSEPMPSDFIVDRQGYGRILTIVAALAGATFALERIGFAPTMLVMNFFILRIMGRLSFLKTTLIAVIGSFGIYYLFTEGLHVPLPAGFLAP
jgi:putative tricarboxylic transport membrane protein